MTAFIFFSIGDQVSVVLTGIDMQNVSVGCVLSDTNEIVPIAQKFQCKIVVFNLKVPITKGYSVSHILLFHIYRYLFIQMCSFNVLLVFIEIY